jgi:hypothetical protein
MTGWEGEGGGGGEYNRECLFNDNSNNNEYDVDDKYNDDDKYDNAEDGKGSRGGADNGGNLTTTVVTSSTGRPLAAWGIGC